jgi:hypothetical protein
MLCGCAIRRANCAYGRETGASNRLIDAVDGAPASYEARRANFGRRVSCESSASASVVRDWRRLCVRNSAKVLRTTWRILLRCALR